MNGLPITSLIEALGWMLLHFLWQGTVIAAVLWCFLRLARNSSAQLRYAAACAALLLMLTCGLATFVWNFEFHEGPAPRLSSATPHDFAPSSLGPSKWTENAPPPNKLEKVDHPDHPSAEHANVREAGVISSVSDFSAIAAWLRPWLSWIVGLWAIGVGFLSLRFFVGWRVICGMRAAGRELEASLWTERFNRLRKRLSISSDVRLLGSASATVPMVIGCLKPVVLVPTGLVTGLSTPQIEALLVHELTHIRRHDYLVNLLQNVVETLFFYQPALWWVSAQIRREREHCCDDVASAACGSSLDYARALNALEKLRSAPTVLTVGASGGSLLERIRRLAGVHNPAPSHALWPVSVLAMLIVLAVVLPLAILSATEDVAFTPPQAAYIGTDKKPTNRSDARLEEVINVVRSNEELYHSIEMESRITYRLQTETSQEKTGEGDDVAIGSSQTTVRLVLQDGLHYLKSELNSTETVRGIASKSTVLEGYDGELTRAVSMSSGKHYARIHQERHRNRYVLEPHMLVMNTWSIPGPLSAYLSTYPLKRFQTLQVAGKEELVNGLKCVKLTFARRRSWSAKRVLDSFWHLWLAKDRNFLPIKTAWYGARFSETLPSAIAEVVDIRQIAPGVWIPIRIKTVGYDTSGLRDDKHVISTVREFIVEKVTPDTKYNVSFFRDIQIPSGTTVRVVKQGRTVRNYIQGSGAPPTILRDDTAQIPKSADWTKAQKWSVKLIDVYADNSLRGTDIIRAGSVLFMPNGRTVVTAGIRLEDASEDLFGEITLRDAATGRVQSIFKKRWRSYTLRSGSLAVSPDGKTIAAAGRKTDGVDKSVYVVDLWDVSTGKIRATVVPGRGPVWNVVFCSDGQTLATTSRGGTVQVWNVASPQESFAIEAHKSGVGPIEYSPNGETLLTVNGDKSLTFWDARNGNRRGHLAPQPDIKRISSVAFSPDGKLLAVAGSTTAGISPSISLWDVASNANRDSTLLGSSKTKLQGHSGHIYQIAFSHNGNLLASASQDKTVKLWDVPAAKELATIKAHSDFVYGIAFSSNDSRLASVARDSLKLWAVDEILQNEEP